MHDATTTKNIIDRATKAMQRRNRDGKPFRPVQDPLIQLAADLQDENDRQAAEIERLQTSAQIMTDRIDALVAEVNNLSTPSESIAEAAEA